MPGPTQQAPKTDAISDLRRRMNRLTWLIFFASTILNTHLLLGPIVDDPPRTLPAGCVALVFLLAWSAIQYRIVVISIRTVFDITEN